MIEATRLPPLTVFKVTDPPPSLMAFTTAPALKLPATTWYVKILAKVALFSGFNKNSTIPVGNFANASFVGAKTVKGPAL